MSNADSEIIKVAFILDYIHLPPFDIHQQLLRARKTCDCCTAGDLLTIRQYERRHFQVGSGCQILFCVGSSNDGRGPSRLVFDKACPCPQKAYPISTGNL